MANGVTFKLDAREFNAALSEYLIANRRENQFLINAKALQIAHQALRYTPKATKGKVKADLRKLQEKIADDLISQGRFQTAKAKKKSKRAAFFALINGLRKSKGLQPVWGAEMAKAAEKFIAARLRSLGFLKAGWIYAIQKLDRTTPKKGRPKGANAKVPPLGFGPTHSSGPAVGQPKGGATPARPNADLFASVFNNIPGALTVGKPALAAAYRYATADIATYMARKKQETARKYRGR